ncbi:MAG: hypothetical protein ACOVP8_00690, partial [Phycisphaerales bacterium]
VRFHNHRFCTQLLLLVGQDLGTGGKHNGAAQNSNQLVISNLNHRMGEGWQTLRTAPTMN